MNLVVQQSCSSTSIVGSRRNLHTEIPTDENIKILDDPECTEPAEEEDHVCSNEKCKRIVINVSGLKFETQIGTLNRYPNTLLGNSEKRSKYWDHKRQEFFFDRHRPTFQAILHFYQSGGKIKRPPEVPPDIFLYEMKFYELDSKIIENYRKKEGIPQKLQKPIMPSGKIQSKIWELMEYPDSSIGAKCLVIFSVSLVAITIFTFCIETLPQLENAVCQNLSIVNQNRTFYANVPNFTHPLFCIEAFCMFCFSLEWLIRLITCPNKVEFFKSWLNFFDLLAILPFFLFLGMYWATGDCGSSQDTGFISVIRILRITRILKLSKHSDGMQMIGKTMTTSWKELVMLTVFLGVCIIIFSSAMYFAEFDAEDSHFESIPGASWWAIITLTTVGYGDMYPQTIAGKVVGSITLLCGILALSFPVPIIVANFGKYYTNNKKTRRGEFN